MTRTPQEEKDLSARLAERSRQEKFDKTMGLLAATTLGLGSLMGAGLYVLVGIAADAAGPAMWVSYVVCGALTFLSVFMFADFARRLPISGGGYIYAYRQLGPFWGFMVGWHLAVGSVFACALYATGFASYAAAVLPAGLSSSAWVLKGMAAALVALLFLMLRRGGRGGDRVQRVLTWGNMIVLLAMALATLPAVEAGNFVPALPNGIPGVGSAISLIYISFFGYQLIANNAEETRDARRTVPLAMTLSLAIAFAFYVLVAVVSVGAVDWRELAASDAPLVLVASRGLLGKWGAALIVAGGILASGAALNGTLLSQGRQLFAMGRDRLLPGRVGTVSQASGVPEVGLLLGAGATVGVIALADLTFIAKAANFALLFSMLPISVALDRLYRQVEDEGEARVPRWRRVIPWAALVANAGLLLTLDWDSLLFGGMMIAAGCAVFFSYSFSSERRAQSGVSVALGEEAWVPLLRRGERILVPMANPRTQESLFSISRALTPEAGGEIVTLSVIRSSDEQSPREVLLSPEETREAVRVLRQANLAAATQDVSIRPVVRAARNLSDAILHAALEERCQLIVMGWSAEDASSPSRLLQELVSRSGAHLVFLQLKNDIEPRRIGVALGGQANLSLMVRIASTLAGHHGARVIYLNVMPEQFEPEHLSHARQVQVEAIRQHGDLAPYATEILRNDSPLEAIVERSRDLDMLVVGATQKNLLEPSEVGAFSSRVAQQAHCSVIVARRSSSLNRVLTPGKEVLRELRATFRDEDD